MQQYWGGDVMGIQLFTRIQMNSKEGPSFTALADVKCLYALAEICKKAFSEFESWVNSFQPAL